MYKTIDRWAYTCETHWAECWVDVGTDERGELVYELRTDRTPNPGHHNDVPAPWFTVDVYHDWDTLRRACPPAVVAEGVYGTSLIGRGELTERDVMRMVGPELEEHRRALAKGHVDLFAALRGDVAKKED